MVQQELFRKIYGRHLKDVDTLDFLRGEIDRYPYFPLSHYFLLSQINSESTEYSKCAAKTAIHFIDCSHLQQMLGHVNDHDSISMVQPDPEPESIPSSETIANSQEPEVVIESMDGQNLQSYGDDITHLTDAATDHVVTDAAADPIPTIETANITQQASEVPANSDEPLLFEPLHTSDYFASQGIKLSEQTQSKDRLGKQMKSFTEWLKTIKKVPVARISANEVQIDQTVETLAAKSNEESEIITESMAEVFAQQGKYDKAIDIYEKLSLLNPDKSLYFADKIRHLK